MYFYPMKWLVTILIIFPACCFSQDILTKNDGDSLKVKILEVGLIEVKYKKYEDPYGITYGILKESDISEIKRLILEYHSPLKVTLLYEVGGKGIVRIEKI